MPPSRVEQLMDTISAGLDAPAPTLPSVQQLQELRQSLEGQNTPDVQQRMRTLLDRVHDQMVAQSRNEIHDDLRGLRQAIGAPSLAPNENAAQPEFTQPFSARRENPSEQGLRSPILGTTAAVGAGIVGASFLWNMWEKPGETIKNSALTVLAAGGTALAAIGAWFGLSRVNWQDVGQSIRNSGIWGGGAVTEVGDGLRRFALWITPTAWHQYLPDGLTRPETEKAAKETEMKNKEQKEQKAKQQLEKEVTQEITKAMNGITGTLVRNPPREIPIRGMNVTLGPDGIYVTRGGQRFRMAATATDSAGTAHTLDINQLSRGMLGTVGFNTVPQPLTKADGVLSTMLFAGSPLSGLSPALIAFQNGSNSYVANASGRRIEIRLNPA